MHSLPTFDLILFGGTGDLAMRKLLPALYRRCCAGQIDNESRVIGAARSKLSRDEYLQQVRATCETHIGSAFDAASVEEGVSQAMSEIEALNSSCADALGGGE